MGAGDVCSFAQLDIRRHGNPQWATKNQSEATQYAQGEDGKTELSLMHFTVISFMLSSTHQSVCSSAALTKTFM